MLVYLFNLGFVVIMSILAEKIATKKNPFHLHKKLPNIYFVLLALVSLILVCGLRWKVGTDYHNYIDMYQSNYDKSLIEVINQPEPLFMFIIWLTSRNGFFPQQMFFLSAVITTSLMVLSIRKYSPAFAWSMFLYITEMSYYSQFNGIRQCMAGAIMVYGFKYILNGTFKKYLFLALFASMVHTSALFLIPIFFVVREKPWSKKIICLCFLFIIGTIFFTDFAEMLAQGDSKYAGYFDLTGGYSSYGVKPIRVLVAAVPLTINILFYSYLSKFKFNQILINFSLLNFLFMFIATQNVALSRMNMYLSLYNIFLIPQFINIGSPKSRRLLGYGIIVCYLAYMIVLLHVDSNLLPYQTIFSNK